MWPRKHPSPFLWISGFLNAFQQKTDNIVSSIEISDLFLIIQCPIDWLRHRHRSWVIFGKSLFLTRDFLIDRLIIARESEFVTGKMMKQPQFRVAHVFIEPTINISVLSVFQFVNPYSYLVTPWTSSFTITMDINGDRSLCSNVRINPYLYIYLRADQQYCGLLSWCCI